MVLLTSIYEITKDILIPILSPILTALTFILFIWQEKKKADLQAKASLISDSNSILRDLMFFREAYQLFGLKIKFKEEITDERIKHLKDLFDKIQVNLTRNPELYSTYINDNTSKNNLTLLVIELQVRINSLTKESNVDSFILFGIYSFLYIFGNNILEIKEAKEMVQIIKQKSPDIYNLFTVTRKDDI